MYGKIFPQLYTGSMVGAGAMAFALWPYIITNARIDEGSTIELNPKILAAIFGESQAKIRKAIEYFCDKDPESRTTTEDGRRLVKEGQFLYRVVNLAAWRSYDDGRAEYWKNYRAERRSKGLDLPAKSPVHVNNVNKVEQITHADAVLPIASTSTSSGSGVESAREGVNGQTDALKLQDHLNRLFGRVPGSRWTHDEECALVEVASRADWLSELEMIERMRESDEPKYKIKSVRSMLENWASHADRARVEKTHPKSKHLEQLKRQLDRI